MLINTFTRAQLATLGNSHRHKKARALFERYKTLHTVQFHERGDGIKDAIPSPGVAVYIMSTSGCYGKPSELRITDTDKLGKV